MHVPLPALRSADASMLRYGENPQQSGYLIPLETPDPLALARFEHRCGPALSYTNWLDADAALFGLCQIGETDPACVIVKHAIPCGAAVAADSITAFQQAWDGDALAAFGSVIAINRPVNETMATVLLSQQRVIRGLLVPEVSDAAVERLARRRSLWVMSNPALAAPFRPGGWEWRSIRGAVLAQQVDDGVLARDEVEVLSTRQPTEDEWSDLQMAWGMVVATRSNAVTIVRDRQLLGAGQQDRLRATQLAVVKAGERAHGAVAASDAFFPFAAGDAPDGLLDAGVTAILQPSGGQKNQAVCDLCNARGAAFIVTRAKRGFRH